MVRPPLVFPFFIVFIFLALFLSLLCFSTVRMLSNATPIDGSPDTSDLDPTDKNSLSGTPLPVLWPRNLGEEKNSTGEFRPIYPHTITRMCVLGERVSGTNWVEETLKMNFPGAQPRRSGIASPSCYRHKHWFHFPGLEPSVEDGDLIFVLFRNAVDWLLHFSRQPHHSHNHYALPFEEFLTRPWAGQPDNYTCPLEAPAPTFANPYYEQYRAAYGGPFPEGPIRDVLQLRAMKIDNFLRLPRWIPSGRDRVGFLRYEDLIRGEAQGFWNLINEIRAHYRITGVCPGDPTLVSRGYKLSKEQTVNLTQIEMDQAHRKQHVTGTAFDSTEAVRAFQKGMDLELERRIGYTYDYLPTLD